MTNAEQIAHNRDLDLRCAAAWQREAATHYAKASACLASGYIRRAVVQQHVARQAYETAVRAMDGFPPGTLSTDAKFATLRAAFG